MPGVHKKTCSSCGELFSTRTISTTKCRACRERDRPFNRYKKRQERNVVDTMRKLKEGKHDH